MSKARILADYVAGGTTAAEFDYLDGVTSNIQTQFTAKAPLASPTFTGTTTVSGDLVPTSPMSHRNIIINGSMDVWARGTSFTGQTSGAYFADRWRLDMENSFGAWTVSKDESVPPQSEGFRNCLKIDCTTAEASPASGDYLFLNYRVEGQDLQHLKKGTASAEALTLSFWVRCTKTGNIQVNFCDYDNTRMISSVQTISATNTWEKKTMTIAGDTTGAFTDDTNESLRIEIWLDGGTDFNTGAAPTAWEALASTDRGAGETLALANSTSNIFYIVGVQLELGSSATPYEHRTYADELVRCQRYYEKNLGGVAGAALGTGSQPNAYACYWTYWYKVPKRASGASMTYLNIQYSDGATFTGTFDTSPGASVMGTHSAFLAMDDYPGNHTVNHCVNTSFVNSSSFIAFESEL